MTDAVEIDYGPPRRSVGIALVSATVAFGLVGLVPGYDVALAGVGVGGIAVGLLARSRRVISMGAAALGGGVIASAVLGGTVVGSLLAGVAAVVAWDVAENAVGLGEQVGRTARTVRAEYVHALASVAVGGLTAGVGFLVYRVASGGQPVTALLLLLVGALALITALRS